MLVLVFLLCLGAVEAMPRPRISEKNRDPAAIREAPVRAETSAHRSQMVNIFTRKAEKDSAVTVAEVARSDLPLLSELVRSAGWWCFEQNYDLLSYENMLLGLQEKYPWARDAIAPGWRVASRWMQLEPSTPHAPMPRQVLMACLVVAASWSWPHVLLSLFLGFYALLRPSDLIGLQRSDLMLPMEHDSPQLGLLIRLCTPKRHVSGARVQYTRVDGKFLSPLVVFRIRRMDRSQLIWPSSATTLGS